MRGPGIRGNINGFMVLGNCFFPITVIFVILAYFNVGFLGKLALRRGLNYLFKFIKRILPFEVSLVKGGGLEQINCLSSCFLAKSLLRLKYEKYCE
jgi:hypothetical protein